MATLAEMRARIAAQENRQKSGGKFKSDGAIYPHWNIDAGTSAVLRFLPDGDPKTEFFWLERQLIKLPFNGIKGQAGGKPVEVQVPCVEMYDPKAFCPVISEVRTWYADESLKAIASKYWKKRSYLFQGFVRQNPIGDDVTPANPIRRFVMSSQLLPLIRAGIMDPEILESPTHYERGLNFTVTKTMKGQYADYSTSSYSRRESALTEVELAAIASHGLFKLADFLPKRPNDAELKIIKEMFDASVNGEEYDVARWGSYYRPFGVDDPSANALVGAAATGVTAPAAPAKAVVESAKPVEDMAEPEAAPAVKPGPSSDKAKEILAMILQRQGKAAA